MINGTPAVKPDYSGSTRGKVEKRLSVIDDYFKDKYILLVGDSQKLESSILKEKGFTNITSMERDFPEEDQICFDLQVGNWTGDQFDLVYCSHVLEHMIVPSKALRNIKKMCKEFFYMYVPEQEACKIYDYHYSCFDSNKWKELIQKCGFRVMSFTEQLNHDHKEYFFKCVSEQ